MTRTEFRVGQRVRWSLGQSFNRHTITGIVTRVTSKGTVFARKDTDPLREEHKFLRGRWLWVMTPWEIAHRDWELAEPPRAMGVRVWYGHHARQVAIDPCVADPGEVRLLAKHLLEISTWLANEPKPPEDDDAPVP